MMDRPDVPDATREGSEAAPRTEAAVRELVAMMIKDLRARQTYVAGNPMIDRFHRDLRDRIVRLWDDLPQLALAVDEGRLLWKDAEVYAHPVGHDNIAFVFFRDGIRQLAFLPGCEERELGEFVGILADVRPGRSVDLLATLWHRDFDFIRMEYVDVSDEETLEVPEMRGGDGEEGPISDLSEIEDVLAAGPVSAEEEAEFADLLLGRADETYLHREMDLEFNRPLARDVTLALLDQFEMRDQERRRQVVDILRELLPRLLERRDFSSVALIVTELQLLANKTGESDTQELVASLLRDMSEAMADLVSQPGREGPAPAEDELAVLLGALQAEAIPTLVRAIPSVPGAAMRERLSTALDRLVEAHSESMVALLRAEDPMLAAEAARIVARLRVPETEGALLELGTRPEPVARQAAIEALGALDTPGSVDAILAALGDHDRSVRAAAVDCIARLRPAAAGPTLLARLREGRLEDLEESEQVAFLKACVAVCGEDLVGELSRLLNGRRWWGGRRPAGLRASAARALGLIGSPAAREALLRSREDRAAAVKSAVRVALAQVDADGPSAARGAPGAPTGPRANQGNGEERP
ncbi:MAG: HEAT repeat domain-containing protein [Gemmatimonadota bacterium]